MGNYKEFKDKNEEYFFNMLPSVYDEIILKKIRKRSLTAIYINLHELRKVKISWSPHRKKKDHGFQRKHPVRTEIILEKEPIEQVSHFSYPGSDVTHNNTDIRMEFNKCRHICDTLKRTLKNKSTKETQIKFYKVQAVPTLLYSSET
jgi:hypothetical protein